MRTDCFAHRCAQTSVRILTAAVRILTDVCAHLHRSDVQFRTDHSSPLLTDVGAHLHRSDIQFRTDHSIPHRPNSSPLRIERPPDGPLILNFKFSETSEDGHPLGNEKVAVLQRWQSYRGHFINDPYGNEKVAVL